MNDRWSWDPAKDKINRRKHGVGLAAGVLVLEGDPKAVSRPDFHLDGDRWQTVGRAGDVVLMLVVHTERFEDGWRGRIIGVRKASKAERRAYEDGEFSEA